MSALHCILWIDDTVIYETSSAFAIMNSHQSQGTGMHSAQAGRLPTLQAMEDWAQSGVFAHRAAAVLFCLKVSWHTKKTCK